MIISSPAIVSDIKAGSAGSYPSYLTAVGSTLYFTADDGAHGREIWKSDGTEAGTVIAADVFPGSLSSEPSELEWVSHQLHGDRLYFAADDGEHGRELWQLDLNEEPLLGDANGYGEVIFADFVILANNFNERTDEGAAAGDFNEDGVVSLADFILLVANLRQKQSQAPSARSVDEAFQTSETAGPAETAEPSDIADELTQLVPQHW